MNNEEESIHWSQESELWEDCETELDRMLAKANMSFADYTKRQVIQLLVKFKREKDLAVVLARADERKIGNFSGSCKDCWEQGKQEALCEVLEWLDKEFFEDDSQLTLGFIDKYRKKFMKVKD